MAPVAHALNNALKAVVPGFAGKNASEISADLVAA